MFDDAHLVPHVKIGQETDLVVVAPATADLLARAAAGRADDLLTNVLLTARCPVVFAPAMHTEMWLHPATQANVATLRERGAVVVDPDSGRLTGPDSGPGRLPEPAELSRGRRRRSWPTRASPSGRPAGTWPGLRVAVSAGGTREHLDPVRFLGQLVVGPDGLGAGPGRRAPRRDGAPGRGERVRAGRRPDAEIEPVDLHRRPGRGDDGRRPRTPTSW